MWTDILPLAIAMMAGPQIISAIVFVTTDNVKKLSLAYILGVGLATTLGVAAAYLIFSLLFPSADLAKTGQNALASTIQLILVAALVLLAIRSYLQREESQAPAWLGKLTESTPRQAFRLGLLVIWLMPTDVLIMLTTGLHLSQSDAGIAGALPFILLVVLLAALPLISYMLFRKQMQQAMPGVRDWINQNGWLVNILVYVLFIFIIL